jgi:outer membrane protein assembly factor BamA
MAELDSIERRPHAWAIFLVWVSVFTATGCSHPPPGRYAIDAVEIDRVTIPGIDTEGTSRGVSASDIEDKIATAESPRFLGIFPRGAVLDYELLDQYVLARDLARIERAYRARGYYDAHVRAGRVQKTEDGHVRVTVIVQEGTPVLVGDVRFEGVTGLPVDTNAALLKAVQRKLRIGRTFDEGSYDEAEQAVVDALKDHGYAFAQVKGSAEVDLNRRRADVTFTVASGLPARFGAITMTGLGDLPEAPVRRALDLEQGEVYSATKLDAARRAVLGLGVFSDVDVVPVLDNPASPTVPVNVRVVPSALRSVKLGGGFELDTVRTDGHILTGWENRNFLGGLRTLTIDLRPGIVLAGTRIPTLKAPTGYFFEDRTRVELRQPGFLEARTRGTLRADFDMYPVIFPPETEAPPFDLGYRDLSAAFGVERFFGPLFASLFYNFQTNFPFTYRGDLPNGFKDVVLSYLSLRTNIDLRNNPIRPHKGLFIGNEVQVAGQPRAFQLPGSLFARDIKVQPEVRGYFPLSRKVTLALRATTGFLFASSYGDTFGSGTPTADDTQLVFFRGFFSGGPSSNRGYAFRGVGPKQQVSFFAPGVNTNFPACSNDPNSTTCQQQVAAHCAQAINANDPVCAYPTGGFSLWEASVEVRFPVVGALGGAVFCDASDVSRFRFDIRLLYPHLSCGLGVHYDTPVGPLRLDAGFQIPGLQVLDRTADPSEKSSDSFFAISFGVGEAF